MVAQVYAMVYSPIYSAWEIQPGAFILTADMIVETFFILDLSLHLYKGVFDPDSQTLRREVS